MIYLNDNAYIHYLEPFSYQFVFHCKYISKFKTIRHFGNSIESARRVLYGQHLNYVHFNTPAKWRLATKTVKVKHEKNSKRR